MLPSNLTTKQIQCIHFLTRQHKYSLADISIFIRTPEDEIIRWINYDTAFQKELERRTPKVIPTSELEETEPELTPPPETPHEENPVKKMVALFLIGLWWGGGLAYYVSKVFDTSSFRFSALLKRSLVIALIWSTFNLIVYLLKDSNTVLGDNSPALLKLLERLGNGLYTSILTSFAWFAVCLPLGIISILTGQTINLFVLWLYSASIIWSAFWLTDTQAVQEMQRKLHNSFAQFLLSLQYDLQSYKQKT